MNFHGKYGITENGTVSHGGGICGCCLMDWMGINCMGFIFLNVYDMSQTVLQELCVTISVKLKTIKYGKVHH